MAAGGVTSEPTLDDVRHDWRVLDCPSWPVSDDVRLLSHEEFTPCEEMTVEWVRRGFLARLLRPIPLLGDLAYAWQLVRRAVRRRTVVLVNGATHVALLCGAINHLLFGSRGSLLCWDVFVETDSPVKRGILRRCYQGYQLSVVWSRPQVASHARFLRLPETRFVYLPFKANHSKWPGYDLPAGRYVFSGGNGKRDYRCLVDAVRGTGIPVVISATDRRVRGTIERLPNIIVIAAEEPAFAQLQAASRFVVIPMVSTGLKGGGEANFCNGMWHGKPVLAADDIAAGDYILEGETGYVVPSGDSARLRERIVQLWNDDDQVAAMGARARQHVERYYTHELFIRRLLRLALLVGETDGRRRD